MVCPECNRTIKDVSKFCSYCGNKVPQSQPQSSQAILQEAHLMADKLVHEIAKPEPLEVKPIKSLGVTAEPTKPLGVADKSTEPTKSTVTSEPIESTKPAVSEPLTAESIIEEFFEEQGDLKVVKSQVTKEEEKPKKAKGLKGLFAKKA